MHSVGWIPVGSSRRSAAGPPRQWAAVAATQPDRPLAQAAQELPKASLRCSSAAPLRPSAKPSLCAPRSWTRAAERAACSVMHDWPSARLRPSSTCCTAVHSSGSCRNKRMLETPLQALLYTWPITFALVMVTQSVGGAQPRLSPRPPARAHTLEPSSRLSASHQRWSNRTGSP